MVAQDKTGHLTVLRGVSLVGGVAVIVFDLVLDLVAPHEPDMTAVRVAVGLTCFAYFIGTFVSAHLRRHAEKWIFLLVALFTSSWLYNCYLSSFSFAISITLYNVVLGCSLAFTDRRLIAWYLLVTMAGLGYALWAVPEPIVSPAIMLTAFAVISSLCYFVIGLWLQGQVALERNQEDLKKTEVLAQVGGWTLDAPGNRFHLSENAFAMLGVEAGSDPDWADALEYLEPQFRQALQQFVEQAWTAGTGFDLEAKCQDRDGGPTWLRILGEPEASARGAGMLRGMVQDISRQKRYESDLIEARDTAERALETRSRFLANMSHEIRTPMNGVIGMASLLREMELTTEQRELVETIHSSGASLLTILNDILDFSKIDEGRIELESEPFSVAQSVAEVVDLLGPRAEEKRLRLVASIDSELPDQLVGDPTRFRQVLANLLSNAIKFTAEGEVGIRVTGCDLGRGDYELEVQVRDMGIGIPEDKLATLFDAFTQADASTTRLYGGTGLGLSISHRLTELMGGSIEVESRQGVGSTFTFTVILTHPTTSAGAVSAQHDAYRPAAPDNSATRVLLAEDNPVNQKVALKMLERLGFQAELATTGREALRAAQQRRFDLILMDVQMPEMDGLEATRRIRDLATPDRPYIVAMTANAMVEEADEYLAAGMDAHLPKPVTLESLRSALSGFAAAKNTRSLPPAQA